MFYGVSLKLEQCRSQISKIFDFISNHTYQAYLAHAILLSYSVRIMNKFLPLKNQVSFYLLSFVLCSMLSLSVAFLINYISKLFRKVVFDNYSLKI